MQIPISLFILLLSNAFTLLTAQDKPIYNYALIDSTLIANARSVIRHEEIRYTIQSPRVYAYEISRAVTILHEDASDIWLRVHYDKYSKAEILYINLYDAEGRLIRKIKKSELIDQASFDGISIFTDNRWKGIQALGGKLPYTIESAYKVTYSETLYYPPWQVVTFSESAERTSLVLDAPASLSLHLRTLNYPFTYTADTVGERQLHRWTAEKITAREKEDAGPPQHEIFPMVFISPSVFQVEDFTGSMNDWQSFGQFIYDINADREVMPAGMQDRIQSMIAGQSSTSAKIDTLYRWLQDNMRYVSVQLGIGGWQSFDAAYVEKNRFGDCKALSTFMKGMLQEAGIQAYTILIEADEHENLFLDDFVFPDFNHMMVYVPGEDMWLECTSAYVEAGQIFDVEENKKVLLITPEGGVIDRTKTSAAMENVIHHIDTVKLGWSIGLRGKTFYTGSTQLRPVYLSHTSMDDQQKYFLEQFPFPINKLNHFSFTQDRVSGQTYHAYQALLLQFGNVSGTRHFIPAHSFLKKPVDCPTPNERKTDYVSHDNFTEIHDCYIEVPGDYTIEHIPAKTELTFRNQSYSLEFSKENNFIRIHAVVSKSPMRLSPQDYHLWCEFGTACAKAANQQLIFKKLRP